MIYFRFFCVILYKQKYLHHPNHAVENVSFPQLGGCGNRHVIGKNWVRHTTRVSYFPSQKRLIVSRTTTQQSLKGAVSSAWWAFRVFMMTSWNWNIFSVTGPLCGNSSVTGEFPTQRPVTGSFDVFFDLRLNKRWSKQSWGWWFGTPSNLLRRHSNVTFSSECIPFSGTSLVLSWWRHQMETFSALLAICAGNSPVPGEFPTQRSVTRSFDVFFDLCLNKRLSKQWWGWWFETLSRWLWRHRNVSTASDKEAILNNRCKRISRVDYGRQYSPNKIKKYKNHQVFHKILTVLILLTAIYNQYITLWWKRELVDFNFQRNVSIVTHKSPAPRRITPGSGIGITVTS